MKIICFIRLILPLEKWRSRLVLLALCIDENVGCNGCNLIVGAVIVLLIFLSSSLCVFVVEIADNLDSNNQLKSVFENRE